MKAYSETVLYKPYFPPPIHFPYPLLVPVYLSLASASENTLPSALALTSVQFLLLHFLSIQLFRDLNKVLWKMQLLLSPQTSSSGYREGIRWRRRHQLGKSRTCTHRVRKGGNICASIFVSSHGHLYLMLQYDLTRCYGIS